MCSNDFCFCVELTPFMKRWMRYTILMCKWPKVQPTKELQLDDECSCSLTSACRCVVHQSIANLRDKVLF